jgi:hypothetical protein
MGKLVYLITISITSSYCSTMLNPSRIDSNVDETERCGNEKKIIDGKKF